MTDLYGRSARAALLQTHTAITTRGPAASLVSPLITADRK